MNISIDNTKHDLISNHVAMNLMFCGIAFVFGFIIIFVFGKAVDRSTNTTKVSSDLIKIFVSLGQLVAFVMLIYLSINVISNFMSNRHSKISIDGKAKVVHQSFDQLKSNELAKESDNKLVMRHDNKKYELVLPRTAVIHTNDTIQFNKVNDKIEDENKVKLADDDFKINH